MAYRKFDRILFYIWEGGGILCGWEEGEEDITSQFIEEKSSDC